MASDIDQEKINDLQKLMEQLDSSRIETNPIDTEQIDAARDEEVAASEDAGIPSIEPSEYHSEETSRFNPQQLALPNDESETSVDESVEDMDDAADLEARRSAEFSEDETPAIEPSTDDDEIGEEIEGSEIIAQEEFDAENGMEDDLQREIADLQTNGDFSEFEDEEESIDDRQLASTDRGNLLDTYRKLLASRGQSGTDATLGEAGSKIGSAIGEYYGSKPTHDKETFDRIRGDIKEEPDLDAVMKTKMSVDDQDPTSRKSQAARQMAEKLGIDVDEETSYNDVKDFLTKANTSKSRPRERSGYNPDSKQWEWFNTERDSETGEVVRKFSGIRSPISTGIIEGPQGQKILAQKQIDGKTQNVVYPDSVDKKKTTTSEVPGAESEKITPEKISARQLYHQLKTTSPVGVKVIDKIRGEFVTQTREDRTSLTKVNRVAKKAMDATTDEIAASQLGAEVATIFEKGRLTDEDVLRYTRRLGIYDRFVDALQSAVDGTITVEKARSIQETLEAYSREASIEIVQIARQKANDSINRMPPDLDISVDDMTKLIYTPDEHTELGLENDPKIKEYAKTHGLEYKKAKQILRKRGYGQ